ncbi:U4/U6 snRNP-specific spliceosomal protein [Thamnocephalis sphaerospora]|uniref:U4/U6 snRNP-specific spliceosomal protein n=1 Tax=Thamnocephalis sphaerospora TaxID=78915 RepID=A0A4P9XXP8_9FUNG|nr:U4/U6 snRNP-specific spliceosomal protein [Thamnocephalis sphaerospora]|eukprot:RKP11168.1 U4/U6 snRNP-specific spliceosomal protein [Thamnocephalis sphaerospora]
MSAMADERIEREAKRQRLSGAAVAEEEYHELPESSLRARAEQEHLMNEFERQRRARTLAVPTDDGRVKARLREIGEPICLFGEGPAERRDRLRYLLSLREDIDQVMEEMAAEEEEQARSGWAPQTEEFYTEGTQALLEARQWIANYSLPRARDRIARQKVAHEVPLRQLKTARHDLFSHLEGYVNYSSQVGDDRPVAQCALSPDGTLLATAAWSGLCKLWQVPTCTPKQTYRGHNDRAVSVAFHPASTRTMEATAVNLASGSADGTINLWSLCQDTPLRTLRGHAHRVCRVGFHPSGRFLGSASFDATWRLWDVEVGTELLLQEGHSHEVYAIAFQDDGALVATGGLDAVGRVWDLRTGRSVMVLDGHVKEVLGVAWSPNGHQLVTGSGDNTLRVFDVRKLQSVYTVAAHTSLVSDVKFYHNPADAVAYRDGQASRSGLFLASSSYDGTVKLWSADDWRLKKTLTGHEGKVMSVDISEDARFIASSGYDRTFKLWAHETTAF